MKTSEIRKWVEQQKGKKYQIESFICKRTSELILANKDLTLHEKAREVVKEVGLRTQQQLQFHISDITSLALDAVFVNPYKLDVEFVERRNKTECDLSFVRDMEGEEIGIKADPLTAAGGGVVDVAAFALRIVSWSMESPRSNNVIILDEPMKFLSVDNQEKASLMIKELSEKLGLQFIIITHEQTLGTYADKVFQVKIKKGISVVE